VTNLSLHRLPLLLTLSLTAVALFALSASTPAHASCTPGAGKRRWAARVDLSRNNRSNHTLTIRGKLTDGRSFKQTRHYRTCSR
jgi:hypothetical protein